MISSRSDADIGYLNPYLQDAALHSVYALTSAVMLRATRVAHINRSIAAGTMGQGCVFRFACFVLRVACCVWRVAYVLEWTVCVRWGGRVILHEGVQ